MAAPPSSAFWTSLGASAQGAEALEQAEHPSIHKHETDQWQNQQARHGDFHGRMPTHHCREIQHVPAEAARGGRERQTRA